MNAVNSHLIYMVFHTRRCSSLLLSVSHLAMLAKSACSLSGVIDWVDQSLADAEEHLKVDPTNVLLKLESVLNEP